MSNKAEQQLLQQIMSMMQSQQSMANTADPNISRLMGLNQSIVDWDTGANGIKDIYKHPLLGQILPVYQMAKSNLDKGRVGRGIVGRTDINNSGYAEDVANQGDTDKSIAASGAIEKGLQSEDEMAQNNIMQLSGLDTQRRQGYFNGANASSGMALNYLKDLQGQGWGGFFRGFLGSV